jgi:hypothetical protein
MIVRPRPCLRSLQGPGGEGIACGWLSARLSFQARIHLSRGAAEGTEFSYRLMHAIYPVFRVLFPNQVIRADDLARAMVDVAVAVRPTEKSQSVVLENRDIRAMVESFQPFAAVIQRPSRVRASGGSI